MFAHLLEFLFASQAKLLTFERGSIHPVLKATRIASGLVSDGDSERVVILL